MTIKISGIIPPVFTVFDESNVFDEVGMGHLIDTLITAGVDGLFFLGSSGEFSQMTSSERKKIAEFVLGYTKGKLPVLIGTGSNSTLEVIELSRHAEKHGADGVVIINPYYWKLSEENLYLHYHEIAESIQGPILLYNFPALTGQDLSPEFVLRLVDAHKNIIGIKETVDSTAHIREMILKVKSKHPNFSILAGYDDHLFNTLALGGDGAISASVNFAPQLSVELNKSFEKGDYEKAVLLHQRLAILPLLYHIETPFINVIKEATKLSGINISTQVLLPSRSLDENQKKAVELIMKQASLLLKES